MTTRLASMYLVKFTLTIAILGWVALASTPSSAQQQAFGLDSRGNATDSDRVEALEKRVDQLERLLFSTAQLTVYEAERRLEDAREQLEESRRLYLKGIIYQHQFEHDRFLVRRAERELELARAQDGQYRIAAEIDLLQAQHQLRLARQQLAFNRDLVNRGLATDDQIERNERELQRAKTKFESAQEKLEAIQSANLEGVDPSK